jgi:hypothetical protein
MKAMPNVRGRDAIAALLKKTLGKIPGAPARNDDGDEVMPKISTMSPAQRRAMFARSRPPPK